MNLAAVGCSNRCRSMARLASIVGVPFAFEDSRVKARASASSCAGPSASANEALFNGAWLITERQLAHEGWSRGFRSNFYTGADAAMLRPLNGFGPEEVHLETTFGDSTCPSTCRCSPRAVTASDFRTPDVAAGPGSHSRFKQLEI